MTKRGRPTKYTEEIAEEICRRLTNGESLQEICHTDQPDRDWVPNERTVYRWLEERADFRRMYACAREAQAHREFEEAKAIALAATAENVQVARLQVDTIKWRAAKLAPRVYGDSVNINHSGEVTTRHDLSALPADELDALEHLVAKIADSAGDPGGEGAPGPDRVH